MKKIFNALVILCCILCSTAVLACSQNNTANITGAACSIKELNNLEKNVVKQRKMINEERNLRPVKINPANTFSDDNDCLFGMCLYKKILDNNFNLKR